MKTVAFIVLPEKGHINPYIGPAQALQDKGHNVVVASIGNISDQIKRAGLQFDHSLVLKGEPSQPMRGEALVELIQDDDRMKAWIKTLLLDVRGRDVAAQMQWLQSIKADVVVVDPLAYTSVIAAHKAGIPWVSMSNSLNPVLEAEVRSDLLDTLEEIQAEREELFQKYDVEMSFSGCDALSKDLTIAFCTEEFVGERENNVHMVGPSLPVRTRGDEVLHLCEQNDLPLIYVSFGSQIYHWPEIFSKLVEATRELPCQLVISAGELARDIPKARHVRFFKYAPQMNILEKAALFITHGGANSVMEALVTDTPVWITPMCNDQFHQAHYIQKSGVGWVEDIRNMSVSEIRERLDYLLYDQDIKKNMSRVSQSYQVNGSQRSADLIGSLL